VLFGVSSLLALSLVAAGWTGRGERVPSPGAALVAALSAWCVWDFASIVWSRNPSIPPGEVRREIAWNLMVMLTFYVAARDTRSFQTLVAAALVSFALLAALAIGLATSMGGWDAGHWHVGIGAFSTYLVLVAPLLVLLFVPPPAGLGDRASSMLLATVPARADAGHGPAFGQPDGLGGAGRGVRDRFGAGRRPLARLASAAFRSAGLCCADSAPWFLACCSRKRCSTRQSSTSPHRRRCRRRSPTIHGCSFGTARWSVIGERPWIGYGFGKSILNQELREELHDPMMSHAHNLFVSQWLQTGAIGFAAFVALLGTLLWRYIGFFRARDDMIAVLGVIGNRAARRLRRSRISPTIFCSAPMPRNSGR
jgi:hypothetical protein